MNPYLLSLSYTYGVTMDYGDIFKRGFLYTWNNKFLYLLGLLAALGGSAGASANANANFQLPGGFGPTPSAQNTQDIERFFENFESNMSGFSEIIGAIVGIIVAVSCLLIVIRVVLWFVRLIAEAGMIQAVSDLDNGIETNFKKAFADGRPFMLNIFMAKLFLLIFPVIILILAIAAVTFTVVPLISSFDPDNFEAIFASIGLIAFPIICLVCLSVPYNLFVGLIYPIAQRGIVFKGMGAMESLQYGWRVLKDKPAEILLLAFLYTVLGFIVGIITTIVSAPIVIGAGWPVFSSLMSVEMPGGGAFALLGVGILAAMIVGALINTVYITFRSSSFTLAYLQLEGKQNQITL